MRTLSNQLKPRIVSYVLLTFSMKSWTPVFVQKLIQFSLCFSLIIVVICLYFSVFFLHGIRDFGSRGSRLERNFAVRISWQCACGILSSFFFYHSTDLLDFFIKPRLND